ncbi:hypothetical protein QM012_007727 [Aureobasidium pullulans]|uniref:Uncharacterized protein n=1 Tax=Aureobasidium pullulans TaxID=5580 RepID=A0ABR0TKH3_AURPU
MAEESKTDDDHADKHESQPQEQQQEEADGTSYDPDADPRDPGRYYTFPHFAEDKPEDQNTDTPEQEPGTPKVDPQASHRNPGLSQTDNDQISSNSSFDQPSITTHTTPIPKSTSPSSTEAVSPPFWPTSPVSKQLRLPKMSASPSSSSPPVLQRRSTTSQPSSPQVSRVQSTRSVSTQIQTQGYKAPSSEYYSSSPAARSLRSISASQLLQTETEKSVSQRPGQARDIQSPFRKQQQQHKCVSSRTSQGSPKSERGKMG